MANAFRTIFGSIWRGLDALRRVLHLLLLLFIFVIVLGALSAGGPVVPGTAALVVAPRGEIVEELAGDPVERAMDEVFGQAIPQTRLRDILDALETARDDERIEAVVLDLDEFRGAGLSKLQDIGAALQQLRDAGKPVIATGNFFAQSQYFLAAQADEVYMHPMGVVYVDGFGRFRTFYKSALDKLRIDWNVFRVGEWKSYAEPYTRDDMSAEDREGSLHWLNGLWRSYQADVTAARQLEPGALQTYAEQILPRLRGTAGDLAQLAVDAGLVDELWTRDQVRQRVIELVGEDEDTHSFNQISHDDYLAATDSNDGDGSDEAVGIVVAAGTIVDGTRPSGEIGGDSTASLLRRARHDDDIRVVVLRVDSGGGSAFASEIIRREVDLLREAGKPVVVSMGSVAASGGYWISASADEIWASPSTITGSIGIIGMFPTFQRTLDWMGVHVDGVGTTSLSGQFRPDRELGEEAREIFQLSLERGYQRFLNLVADNRGMSVEAVDRIARGRVWTGEDAFDIGIIDQLGNLDEAVESAAGLAGLDDWQVRYIEQELSFEEALALRFLSTARSLVGERLRPAGLDSVLGSVLSGLREDLEQLARFKDPMNQYAYCFCRPD